MKPYVPLILFIALAVLFVAAVNFPAYLPLILCIALATIAIGMVYALMQFAKKADK